MPRNWSCFTAPSLHSIICAVSAMVRSSRKRAVMAIRWLAGSSPTAWRSRALLREVSIAASGPSTASSSPKNWSCGSIATSKRLCLALKWSTARLRAIRSSHAVT